MNPTSGWFALAYIAGFYGFVVVLWWVLVGRHDPK